MIIMEQKTIIEGKPVDPNFADFDEVRELLIRKYGPDYGKPDVKKNRGRKRK